MEAGFRCIKLKIGAINFEEELALLRHIRTRFSSKEIELRVDANGAFSPVDAMEKLKRLSELDLHSIDTVFQVPWAQIGACPADWPENGSAQLHALGFKTAAMALSDRSVSIDDNALAAEPKLAIVLGTEGDGLAHSTIAACDYTVKIPMSHGVDSLNVAAASAVAFWQLGRT